MIKAYGEDGYTSDPVWYKCQKCGEYVELDDKVYWVQKDNKWVCKECAWEALDEYFDKHAVLSTFFPSEEVTDVPECRERL
jgi:DNA-directed RNA polymerase subunit RPC12/RpoP